MIAGPPSPPVRKLTSTFSRWETLPRRTSLRPGRGLVWVVVKRLSAHRKRCLLLRLILVDSLLSQPRTRQRKVRLSRSDWALVAYGCTVLGATVRRRRRIQQPRSGCVKILNGRTRREHGIGGMRSTVSRSQPGEADAIPPEGLAGKVIFGLQYLR